MFKKGDIIRRLYPIDSEYIKAGGTYTVVTETYGLVIIRESPYGYKTRHFELVNSGVTREGERICRQK